MSLPDLLADGSQGAGPTLFDLFCGPGGFSTGFEWAGFTSRLGVDIHEPSLATFDHMHPYASAIHADIREIEASDIRDRVGPLNPDVMTAGIPCEGFSRANRNRNRYLDARNFL